MEKITKEQFYETSNKKGLGKKNEILLEVDNLEIDEGIKIPTEKWFEYYSLGSVPSAVIGQTFRESRTDKKFTTHILKDNSGWLVLRIK